uniref:Resolvase n=2 Tax=unclassified bacterial viruses TaxID=12333 RepID=A0AAU7J7M0_9VIRU
MQKYAVDQAVIDDRRAKEGRSREQIVTRIIEFDGAYREDLMMMGFAVATALDLRGLKSTARVDSSNPMHPRGKPVVRLHVIGFESDVAQAEILIRSLHVQALLAMKDWWRTARTTTHAYTSPSEQSRARGIFINSFGTGAGLRIRENRRTVVEESGTGTDLMLLDRKALVDEFFEGMNTRKGRASRRRWDSDASIAGHSAGKEANTGERSMTQGRGLPAGAGR